MTKLLSVFITCFCILFTFNASADWCRNVSGGGISPCNSAPSSWSDCGTFQGDTVWCYKSGGAKSVSSDKNNNTMMLVSVGIGLAVIAASWYFFRKPPSENYPGQVQLATF